MLLTHNQVGIAFSSAFSHHNNPRYSYLHVVTSWIWSESIYNLVLRMFMSWIWYSRASCISITWKFWSTSLFLLIKTRYLFKKKKIFKNVGYFSHLLKWNKCVKFFLEEKSSCLGNCEELENENKILSCLNCKGYENKSTLNFFKFCSVWNETHPEEPNNI